MRTISKKFTKADMKGTPLHCPCWDISLGPQTCPRDALTVDANRWPEVSGQPNIFCPQQAGHHHWEPFSGRA